MSIKPDADGTVLRYLNPHFGYDVRNTLKKHNLMPASWSDDSVYLAALKSGFTVSGISIPGTSGYDTFVEFIEGMQSLLVANAMTAVSSEFETMQIAYPFTIRKYRGSPSGGGATSGAGSGNSNAGGGQPVQGAGVLSVSPSFGVSGSVVALTIVLDADAQPPLPPSNVSPSDVQVAGVSLSGIVRSGATTISGNLTIPSGATPGAKDVVVSFTTPRGTIQFTGTGLFSFQ
tara:strand:- start:128 stop:820 length:693 start_codon:yes stop_codon:yes gene_type:complete